MIKKIILGLTLLLSMGYSTERNQNRSNKEIKNYKKIALNKTYKNSVNSTNLTDIFLLENLKSKKEYLFKLKNIGDLSKHPYNQVQFKIEDEHGNIIKFGKLSAIKGDLTYNFTPNTDDNLYLKFYSKHSEGYYVSNYEFKIV